MCDWADWDNDFRFVFSKTRVDGTNFVLSPTAAQLPDGSIDTEATVTTAPPHVTIYELVDGEMHEGLRVNLKDASKRAQGTPRGRRRDRPVGEHLTPLPARIGPPPQQG